MTQSRNSKISESNYNCEKEGEGWMQMMTGNIIILIVFSCHTLLSQIETSDSFFWDQLLIEHSYWLKMISGHPYMIKSPKNMNYLTNFYLMYQQYYNLRKQWRYSTQQKQ
jgi:hypothetical protein